MNQNVLSDGYVKYEEAEVHRYEKMRKKNGRLAAILDFITAKFVMG